MSVILIYGAYGYTGELIVEEFNKRGVKPILAGRREEPLKKLADAYEMEYKAFELSDKNLVAKELEDVDVVLHCAGPFIHTAKVMADACILSQTHYLDITGEFQVFEEMAALNDKAEKANIAIMPGVGFDVVPSDCLASYLFHKLPTAIQLQLAFFTDGGGISRGTAKSALEGLGNGGMIRKDHQLMPVEVDYKIQNIDFHWSQQQCAVIPWGDISTAYRTTGIPDIEVFMAMTPKMISSLKWGRRLSWLMRQGFVKNYLRKQIDNRKPGPVEKSRKKANSYFWGRVIDNAGNELIAVQKTMESYTLTSKTATDIAIRFADESFTAIGYQTPGGLFGEDYILKFKGSERKDLTF